jgi:hypothetical protein
VKQIAGLEEWEAQMQRECAVVAVVALVAAGVDADVVLASEAGFAFFVGAGIGFEEVAGLPVVPAAH